MTRAIAVLLVAVAGLFPNLGRAQKVIEVRHSTILILVDPPSEVRKHHSDQDYIEGRGDFEVYTNRMLIALKGQRSIQIRRSSSDSVRFPGTQFKTVYRRGVRGGWGYVFFRPGREPLFYEGVAVDEQLVCTAVRMFEIKVEGYRCGL